MIPKENVLYILVIFFLLKFLSCYALTILLAHTCRLDLAECGCAWSGCYLHLCNDLLRLRA